MSKLVTEITSLKDAGYQGCISSERGTVIGKFIYTKCSTFLESIPDEVKSELEAGQMLRFNELRPAQYFTDNWTPCEPDTKGARKIDINVVMAYSSQVFGTFRNEDPIKHGIHKVWRDDWSDYKTNCKTNLRKYVKAYIDSLAGKKRERAVTKSFAQWLKDDVLKSIKARAVTAKGRGDDTVDDAVVAAITKAIK